LIHREVKIEQRNDQSLRMNIGTEERRSPDTLRSQVDDVRMATILIPTIEQNKDADETAVGRFLIRERIQDRNW